MLWYWPITPPQSSMSSPPMPLATEEQTATSISRILAEVRRRKYGHHPSSEHWLGFPLNSDQYEEFDCQIRKDDDLWGYYDDKIRYDYFPSDELYVLRRPEQLHAVFKSYIEQELLRQLHEIAQCSSPDWEFFSGSANIVSEESEYGSHSPDAYFRHFKAQYPGVILELYYSQKKRYLSRLANDYILGSNSNIGVVIGIKVEYKGSNKASGKAASVFIYRSRISMNDSGAKELTVVKTVSNQLFRDDEGKLVLNSQASLNLRLEDFCPRACFATNYQNLTDSIHISAEQLFSFLEPAEKQARMIERREGVYNNKILVTKRKHIDSTPPEVLNSEPKGRLEGGDERAAKKTMTDNSSSKACSSDANVE